MRKFNSCLILLLFAAHFKADSQTQSIIYDAATLMNAKYGVNGLLIPEASGYDIEDPITGKIIDPGVDPVPSSFMDTRFSSQVILSVLKRNAGLPQNATAAEVKSAYASNPFLIELADSERTITRFILPAGKSMNVVSSYATSPAVGSLGQNILRNLVNGTADFLIKRAQEEISISVFEKLKQFLSHYPELDTLFPRTCAMIKPVSAYEYTKALQAIKDAIREDIGGLVPRIALLYDLPRYRLLNRRVPSLSLVFSASTVISELHNTAGFAETMRKLGEKKYLDEQNNYTSFLKILTIISNSFLDKKLSDPEEKTPQYIHREFIGLATHDNADLLKELSSIYLGLIWQHTAGITFVTGTSQVPFNALLGHWVQNPAIAKALQTLNVSLNAIQSANEELNEIKKQEYDESQLTGKLEMKAKRFTVYGQLVNKGLGLAEIFIDPSHSSAGDRLKEIRDYWPAFTSGIITMTKDFKEEEYSLGISKLAEILRTVSDYLDEVQRDKTLAGNLSSDLGAALAVRKARLDSAKGLLETRIIALPKPTGAPLLDANIEGERQELLTSLHEIETELKQIKFEDGNRKSVIFRLSRVIEYIDLLAAITKAENSEAVESLLESYALPAGSSRIKKIAAFNIAVNAYVGGFFGRPKNQGEGFTNTYGFTAPIGFSFSTGFRKAGSLSLFANILDIGGAIRYKLDNQGKYQQDISLAGIVSPGVHAVFGFPWFIPVSAGLGCQWVSPVTSNSNKIELKAGFNAFVAVDIPLFNLKVKKGK